QVLHDMLGIYDDCRPLKHAKRYATLGEVIRGAVREYIEEVEEGAFPTRDHSFDMDEATLGELVHVS
ncbi:MAG TPA: 3-methyl-2-oxobutanoate hydroxymethyltransferase, partial [Tepidiformaceae bacterium]